jgi:hypothetical protein
MTNSTAMRIRPDRLIVFFSAALACGAVAAGCAHKMSASANDGSAGADARAGTGGGGDGDGGGQGTGGQAAGGQGSGGRPDGAGGGQSSGGAPSAGGGAGGGGGSAGCPTSPPIDAEDAQLRDRCTKRIYLAGGDDFRLTYSVDEGQTWQQVQPVNIAGDDFVNDLAVGKGSIVVMGLPGVFASADGARSFAAVPALAGDSYGGEMVFGGGRFVLLDKTGTFLSTDGIAWSSQIPFPDNSYPNGFGGHYHGRAYGNQTYVFFQEVGQQSNVFRTFDGATWTEGKVWGPLQYKDASNANLAGSSNVIFDGSKFILYANYGGTAIYTSPDGSSWTRLPPLAVSLLLVVYQDGVFFGIGKDQLLFSQDGIAWTGVHAILPTETYNINGPRLAVGRILK